MLNELPIGIALIPCEYVLDDIRTRKKSIVNIISQLRADKFPFQTQSFSILITLTGCVGNFPCTLRCIQDDTLQEVMNIQCDIKSSSVNDVVDVVVNFKALTFPVPGSYTFSVVVDGIPIMFRPISVLSKVKKPVPPHESA